MFVVKFKNMSVDNIFTHLLKFSRNY